jgi:hypothetical protein
MYTYLFWLLCMMGEEAQSLCNEPVLTTKKDGLLIGRFF